MAGVRGADKIILAYGDIFELEVQALINPTNTDLLMGAGIAGEIRKRGGSAIQEECLEIGSAGIGQAVTTGGGNLPHEYIIHAATMKIGGVTTRNNLIAAIRSADRRINELHLSSVAFPPMGIGVGRFPLRSCAEVMLTAILETVVRRRCVERVHILLPEEEMYILFEQTFARLTGSELGRPGQ